MKPLDQIAAEYSNGGHSIFGPSSSHRWLTCSGSLIPNILAPDSGNAESAYGTVAHEVSETWLKDGRKPKHLLGRVCSVDGFDIEIDQRMLDYVQESVDRCEMLDGVRFTERKVYFSRLTPIPNQGGTLDYAVVKGRHVTVIDHKYGQIPVYAEENPQGMLYALGLLYELDAVFDLQEFTIAIHQPRINNFDTWECTRDELMEFAGYVKARARSAWSYNAPRTPDPKACQFCAVRATCAANVQMQFKLMSDMSAVAFTEQSQEEIAEFSEAVGADLYFPKPQAVADLTTEHLASLWPYRSMVDAWWKELDRTLLLRMQAGERPSGVKPVEGRSRRRWTGEAAGREAMAQAGLSHDEMVTEKVISPSNAEALLRKHGVARKELPALLGHVIEKPKGKPTVAPIYDKRPAITDLSDVAFNDIEDLEDDESE